MLLHANLRFESALQCYSRARALAPESFRWLYYLGSVQLESGRFSEAAASLAEALTLDEGYQAARHSLAYALLESGDADGAKRECQAILSANPDSASGRYSLGRALAAMGDTEGAITELRRACELHPTFGAAHYALALAYRTKGDTAASERHLDIYRRHTISSPPADDPLMLAVRRLGGSFELVRQGANLANTGRLLEAEGLLLRAVEDRSTSLDAHVILIAIYTTMGRPEDGERHFRAALSIDPESEDAHFNYGVLLASQQKLQEAAPHFARTLEINPGNADAHLNLGYCFEWEGQQAAAEDSYRAAISLEPHHPGANFRLGRLVLHGGDAAAAIERFQATLAADSEHTLQALYGLATAHAIAGDLAQAVNVGERALRQARTEGNDGLQQLIASDIELWTRQAAGFATSPSVSFDPAAGPSR